MTATDAPATREAPQSSSLRRDGSRHRILFRPASRPGMLTALLFFSLSLTTTMLPRTAVAQGIVSGITVALGYGTGASLGWLWRYLQLPVPHGRARRVLLGVWLLLLAVLSLTMVWRRVGLENDLRALFGIDPVSPMEWLGIVPIAALVATGALLATRSVRVLFHVVLRPLGVWLPERLATVLGTATVVVLLWGLWTGVFVNGAFSAANWAFQLRDAVTDEGVEVPTSDRRSGGPDSLVAWDELGRKGRSFVGTGPTVEELAAFHGRPGREPVRVYVGLRSAPTVEARAALLLDELVRTGAFSREVLVIGTTTGTGLLQPQAVDALEWVHNGDTAIAGVQYTYLPSWISLLADQREVERTSQVVFDTVHAHWSQLPPWSRPEIYLYGLSLGATGVESVLGSLEMLNEPIDGALLVGPPYLNELHDRIVEDRDPGSTPWLPVYEDGHTVRFTDGRGALDLPEGEWGDTRIVYLQHPSDPVVFFDPTMALRRPAWLDPALRDERPPDVSPAIRWTPLITFWQVLADMPAAGDVPDGLGHNYSLPSQAAAWAAITRPEGWTEDRTAQLQAHLRRPPAAG